MSDGTRAAGALQTREALLDAGAALAEEHGLAGVSVNMVVARAGVAKGTFYVHFSGRAATRGSDQTLVLLFGLWTLRPDLRCAGVSRSSRSFAGGWARSRPEPGAWS
jgi:AcrR family transcriptional regulator